MKTSYNPTSWMSVDSVLLAEKLALLSSNPLCTNHSLLFKLKGKDLPVKDNFLQGWDLFLVFKFDSSSCIITCHTGGKADPFIQIHKAHGLVQGSSASSAEFVAPVPNKYMGKSKTESVPLYNGERDHCPNTLDPVFKTVEISDLSRHKNIFFCTA